AKQTRLEILKLYEEDPEGWHILIGRDKKGYRNTSIIHRKELWLIKEEVINPFETVGYALKTTLKNETLPLLKDITFGLRPIQGTLEDTEMLLKAILEQKPLPPSEIITPYVAEGPYIFSEHLIAPSQIELDNRLTAELDRLVERRYSYLRRIYG
ncbi:MAG: hypothetical protein ACK4TI_02255, partial [Nitrososphaerales archaeon]